MPNAFNRRRPARQGARAAGRARNRGGARTRVQRARESASLHDRLARVLDTPHLARLVPQLAPGTLHQLIRHRGLDACGELVAAATPGQLTAVFDIDLWRSARPGQPDAFDEERFAEWVEALVDMGEAVAARTVAAVDERLIAAGLSRYVRVLDPGIFMPTSPDRDDEAVDPFPFEGPSCECGGYVIRARRIDGWEAMVAFVRTLAATHPECFAAVMQGCRRLSNSAPEIDGLDELLPEPAQALHDVGAERGGRRARQGYLAPADARAFLEMSRQPAHHRGSASPSRNPIAAAYFRAADRPAATGRHAARPGAQIGDTGTAPDVSASIEALVELLAEAGLTPERPRALLEGHTSGQRPLMVHTLMEYVRDADEAAYAARTSELAFLTNALIAGCSVQSRAFTVREASDAAVAVCNLGLEHWPAHGLDLPEGFLLDRDLVSVFQAGWSMLHTSVSMFVAGGLLLTLRDLQCIDVDIQQDLDALRSELARHRGAGTPWRALHALDAIAMLDPLVWTSLGGLLGECPVLPDALTALLERRTGAVSPTAFRFISTGAHLDEVRTFVGQLLELLSQ